MNRLLGRLYTSLNPVFTVLNGARDLAAATIGMIGPVVRRAASSTSTISAMPRMTSHFSGTAARSVKSSPPQSA